MLCVMQETSECAATLRDIRQHGFLKLQPGTARLRAETDALVGRLMVEGAQCQTRVSCGHEGNKLRCSANPSYTPAIPRPAVMSALQ